MSGRLRLVSRARLKHDPVRGTHVLLVPEAVLELNPQAREVLALCDGLHTEDDIIEELGSRYPGTDVGPDVRSFVARLEARGFLERGP